jgi:hypothetical protein
MINILASKSNFMKLIAQVVIGYMYKVLKSGRSVTYHKIEFAAIRHGDYMFFLNLIGRPIDAITTYSAGNISNDVDILAVDCDFVRLIKSCDSLRLFYHQCIKTYGHIADRDLPDSVFEDLAIFELSLRMHRNNRAQRIEY